MGDHMPVHLGSMPMSVRAAIESLRAEPGDVVMLNDPFRGGTHLPDITLVAPVFVMDRQDSNASRQRPALTRFLCGSRAHHADVGGAYAGSMGLCREIYQEGLRIPPVRIMRGGVMRSRRACSAAEQCSHPGGARGRSGSADCRLPHRSGALAGSLPALWSLSGRKRAAA